MIGADSAQADLLTQAADEFLERVQRGERPAVDEYVRQYPAVAEELREVLPALLAMQPEPLGRHLPDASGGADLEAGRLGDFRILREVGRGGMGVVYEAEQISLQRRVALKVLPFAAALDPKRLERFKNEAQAGARLHHSQIVPVYAVGCERGVYYYAMQMIDGLSLAEVIAQLRPLHAGRQSPAPPSVPAESQASHGPSVAPSPPPPLSAAARCGDTRDCAAAAFSTVPSGNTGAFFRVAARLAAQAAGALEHAHQQDVVHRDVKPANLLVDTRGDLWITDFGLARMRADAELTMTGDVVGTYRYMSPEQAQGRNGAVDHRTDVYSLGATLYELLTLQPAFDGESREQIVAAILSREPPPLRKLNRAVPTDLETIVLKALAKDPQDRYATAAAMAEDLHCFLESRPIRARRPGLVERTRKWSRRHRKVVGWSVAALLLAVLGLAVSNVLIAHERAKTRAAYEEVARRQEATAAALAREAQQRTLAEQSLRHAREMLDFVVQTSVDSLANQRAGEDLSNRLLLASLEYYQGYIERSRDNPAVQAELASSHLRVAKILEVIGATPAAHDALERALETQERLVRERPQDVPLRRGLFSMYFHLGVLRGGFPFYVASKPSVQSHLKLKEEQIARIRHTGEELEAWRREFCESRSTDLAQMRGQFREHQNAAQRGLADVLDEQQRARLGQIVLQWQGTWAFGDRAVADQIGLTPSQRSRIWTIQEETFRQPRKHSENPRQSAEQRVLAVLTDAQRDLWRQMLGPPFERDRFRPSPPPARRPATTPRPSATG